MKIKETKQKIEKEISVEKKACAAIASIAALVCAVLFVRHSRFDAWDKAVVCVVSAAATIACVTLWGVWSYKSNYLKYLDKLSSARRQMSAEYKGRSDRVFKYGLEFYCLRFSSESGDKVLYADKETADKLTEGKVCEVIYGGDFLTEATELVAKSEARNDR